MTNTKLTIEECIAKIEGNHDFPECDGTASLDINGNGWMLSCYEGCQCWWDNAPTYQQLAESEFSEILDPDWAEYADAGDTVDECHINRDFIAGAHSVCASEEAAYAKKWLNTRIETILENVDGMKVYRDYPRDFANEFSLVIDDERDAEPLTRDELETILQNWLTDDSHYGDLLSEFDTYSPN